MKKLLFLLCLLPLGLFAQTTIKPDCSIPFSFSTTASTSNLTCGNNTLGITNWVLVYTSTGFSAISLVVQSAPDVAGAPGSWGTFGGTVLTTSQYPGSSGINPNTSITSANTGLAGYFPWVRINLASITGTGKVTGSLYGFLNSTLSKAGGGGGGGSVASVSGTANQIVCSPTTGAVVCSIATNPVLPGVATANGFQSNEPFSGNLQLNGFTSGNVTLTVADVAGTAIAYMWPSTNGVAGQVLSDSGVATCPTLPAGAPTVCHQLAWIAAGGGGSGGGGVLGYSGTAIVLPVAGTTFLAAVGGALASTTEGTVSLQAPAAAPISNMYVSMTPAPGTGNTATFTFRDAGGSTALTCTISGAGAGGLCNDTTHSFTPAVNDALDIQVVTTGTVTATPVIKIIAEYGVTGGGGGGGVSYHYTYYGIGAGGGVGTAFSITGILSANNGLTFPSGGIANTVTLGGFPAAGSDGVIELQLPSTWDGSAVLLNVDAVFTDGAAGTANFQAYTACNNAAVFNTPTWSAASATVGAVGGTANVVQRWALSAPVTGCVAGDFFYLDLNRPAGDSYTNTIFMIGASIGIKY
jgi:hypothetical protein